MWSFYCSIWVGFNSLFCCWIISFFFLQRLWEPAIQKCVEVCLLIKIKQHHFFIITYIQVFMTSSCSRKYDAWGPKSYDWKMRINWRNGSKCSLTGTVPFISPTETLHVCRWFNCFCVCLNACVRVCGCTMGKGVMHHWDRRLMADSTAPVSSGSSLSNRSMLVDRSHTHTHTHTHIYITSLCKRGICLWTFGLQVV